MGSLLGTKDIAANKENKVPIFIEFVEADDQIINHTFILGMYIGK